MERERPGAAREREPSEAAGAALVDDAMSRAFERFGLRGVLGRVWTALYMEEGALDADSLRERLGVSAGTLSTALNELADLGFVRRESAPGEKRFFYRAETELWPLVARVFRERERARIAEIVEALRAAEAQFAGVADPAGRNARRAERIRRLVGIGGFALDLLDAITERTKVEMKAAQKWLEVSSRLGGEPLNRLRKRINARHRP